ncbi:nicotinamidase [Aspergillus saccharolyticus JOP 1030-1]|uniref:nicotinamidase n=1 Tax=Aspergillus saccharolyticus JOP 1030-1 TaxID=1450539 RepID=A0A319A094_9EURO|nr:putative isochorismatase family hydrolase [Aspergillus saccharolyticus JOP 1030-1]PYH49873.1 putative isochorismatase family hydrolase [Aspergillus saccharolyticus JOP 1030-1]
MTAALVVVDMQEDFCPPNGSLAVTGARDLAPTINALLAHPGFTFRVSSQDYHPRTHISFASNHPAPNNQPFSSTITLTNPAPGKHGETKPQRLWPVHCVADTPGAALIPELDASRIDLFVKKGMDERVEMYSVFADAFGNRPDPALHARSVDYDLEGELRARGVTKVFAVGVAGDYCVKCTAVDAARAGFESFLVEDATRCVDPGEGWEEAKRELRQAGVRIVKSDGPEVRGLMEGV